MKVKNKYKIYKTIKDRKSSFYLFLYLVGTLRTGSWYIPPKIGGIYNIHNTSCCPTCSKSLLIAAHFIKPSTFQ